MTEIYRPARWSLEISQAASARVVTADAVALHLNLTTSDDLALIDGYVETAEALIAQKTNRALLTETRILRLDRWPARSDALIELPGGHVQSVTGVAYRDTAGATVMLDAAVYAVDLATTHGAGRIGLAWGQSWPDLRGAGLDVAVTDVAGWPRPSDVPRALRQAILMVAAELYEGRRAERETGFETSPWFRALVEPWRLHRVAA